VDKVDYENVMRYCIHIVLVDWLKIPGGAKNVPNFA